MTVGVMPRKVPGLLPQPPKTEIDGKVKDLNVLTKTELLELRDRQQKILNNTAFITKLPDKGAKIIAFKQKIDEKLKIRDEEEIAREMLEKLSLNTLDQETVQNVEWKGKMETTRSTYLDSDDDSEPEDVLTVLSQNTSHERKVKILNADQSLITNKDLEEIYPSDQIAHIKYIMNKTEKTTEKTSAQFKPYRTTKTDVHDPAKEKGRPKHKNWEVTAATPPPLKHGPVKLLNIEESVRLQAEQNRLVREAETKHAAERLMLRTGLEIGDVPVNTQAFRQYRDVLNDESEDSHDEREGSDNEVHDEEPERGGVVFSVMK